MIVSFTPLAPWTQTVRGYVEEVACDMADLDASEIFGLRPSWHTSEDLVDDLGQIMRSGLIIDGFLAWRVHLDQIRPVAVAVAFRSNMPRTAEIAMFGRRNERRAMVEVYRELATRQAVFGHQYGISIAQVPILDSHEVARVRARRSGGREVFSYGPIGTDGQSYTHTIWRL